MTDLTFTDPCVLFALRRESRAFRHEFRPNQRFSGAPCIARFCSPRELPELSVLVLETGVGGERTRRALDWALSRPELENVPYRPRVILSAGFCGALQEDRHVGDVILADEVTDIDGNRWATWPGELPAGEWRPPLHRGRVLTLDRIVGTPEEKRTLGRRHEASAVDLESAVAAQVCRKQGVPFGCIRAVSDGVNDSLSPALLNLLRRGAISYGRLVVALLSSPALGGELWQLSKQTRLAARQLGLALGELLTLTL